MKKITFVITKDEVRGVSELNSLFVLSDKEVQEILCAVECDEKLWDDIRKSIA